MAIYLVLIGLTVVCGFAGGIVSQRKSEKWGKIIKIAIPLFAFYLVCSLKANSVGIDTVGYAYRYTTIGQSSWSNIEQAGFEYGYCFLNKLFYSMGFSWNGFLFFAYLLVFVPLGIVLYWRSETPTTSLLMLIALFMALWFSAFRQSIASSISILGISLFYSQKKPWHKVVGILLMFTATMFHESAYIGFLAILFYFLKFEKVYLIVIIPFSILFFFLSPYIYQTVYLLLLTSSNYMASIYDGGGLFFAYLLMLVAMAFFFKGNKVTSFCDDKTSKVDEKLSKFSRYSPLTEAKPLSSKYANLVIWAMVVTCIVQATCRGNLVLSRLHNVMLITVIMYFPSIINSFKSRTIRTALFVIMDAAFIFLTIYDVLLPNYLNLSPYLLFFQ